MIYLELVIFVIVNLIITSTVYILILIAYPNLQESLNKYTSVHERLFFGFRIPLSILNPLYYIINPAMAMGRKNDGFRNCLNIDYGYCLVFLRHRLFCLGDILEE